MARVAIATHVRTEGCTDDDDICAKYLEKSENWNTDGIRGMRTGLFGQ